MDYTHLCTLGLSGFILALYLTNLAVSRHRDHWTLGRAPRLRPRALHLPRDHIRDTRRGWTGQGKSTTASALSYRTPKWSSSSLQSCAPTRRACAKHKRSKNGCAGCSLSVYTRGEGGRAIYHLNAWYKEIKHTILRERPGRVRCQVQLRSRHEMIHFQLPVLYDANRSW